MQQPSVKAGAAVTRDLPAKPMLDLVLDALPVGLFWKDLDSRILGCNQKFADDSGVASPADLIGKTNFDFYPPEQAEAYRADDLEVISTGVSKLGFEEPLLLATGETAWVETNKVPMRNDAGEVVGVLGTYCDVSARRRAGAERERFALELAIAKQAAALAMIDTLTGLPNRRYLRANCRGFCSTPRRTSALRLSPWIWIGSRRSMNFMGTLSAMNCFGRWAPFYPTKRAPPVSSPGWAAMNSSWCSRMSLTPA